MATHRETPNPYIEGMAWLPNDIGQTFIHNVQVLCAGPTTNRDALMRAT